MIGKVQVHHLHRLGLTMAFGVLLLLCLFSTTASALTTVPTKMNFQGRLTDAAGNIKPDGTYNMKLRLYTASSGGSSVWSEDRLVSASQGVPVANGLFSIKLGDISALSASLFASGDLYLEVELPTPATATSSSPSWTEGAMTPRSQMATSAYAYNAETLDGLDSTAFVQLASANTFTAANEINVSNSSAFKVRSGATSLFNVDTSGSKVTIGTSDTTGTLLVLDVKTDSGDPTGTIGAMYYNSNSNKFRCYQNTAWTDCIGAGGGGGGSESLQDVYDNSSTPATITTTSSTKTFLFKAGSTYDATALFSVQNAAGTSLFVVDSSNSRVYVGNPTADSTGTLFVLDNKNTSGDPGSAVDGAMYYNSNSNRFRCYQDGSWRDCFGGNLVSYGSMIGTTTNAGNSKGSNGTIYVAPLYIPAPITVNSLRTRVQGTALGSSGDIGVYDSAGTRVLNGGSGSLSTGLGAKDVTPTQSGSARVLQPGQYYVAITWNNTTGAVAAGNIQGGSMYRAGTLSSGGGSVLPSSINLNNITDSQYVIAVFISE